MKVSNRVKRNISLVLLVIGLACTVARIWYVVMDPSSGKAWFNLFGIIVLTYICFDRVRELQKRIRKGIVFGSR